MKLNVCLVQTTVSKSLEENLATIKNYISQCGADNIVIFPEGMLSGYFPAEDDFLDQLDSQSIDEAIHEIQHLADEKALTIIFGSATFENGKWFNSAILISQGKKHVYHKVNLANLDRNHFEFGDELPVYQLGSLKVGIQLCREINFPEQWRYLKHLGAQIVFHPNNNQSGYDSWVHMLRTRAYENGFYVVSVNVSHKEPQQLLYSYVMSPNGEILLETQDEGMYPIELELDLPTKHFTEQRRFDLFPLPHLTKK